MCRVFDTAGAVVASIPSLSSFPHLERRGYSCVVSSTRQVSPTHFPFSSRRDATTASPMLQHGGSELNPVFIHPSRLGETTQLLAPHFQCGAAESISVIGETTQQGKSFVRIPFDDKRGITFPLIEFRILQYIFLWSFGIAHKVYWICL